MRGHDNRKWSRLTKRERARYMVMQMSHGGGGRSAYLPDDCSECGMCGNPILGYGWCDACLDEFIALDNKLRGLKPATWEQAK